MSQEQEIPLNGGRITQGVVRKGDVVLRPACANAAFVHAVLRHLEEKNVGSAPRFLGMDERGREKTTFLEGWSPRDLGWFSDEQCTAAARIIRTLHGALAGFHGCPPGLTVCHNDLSPCNFMFRDGLPYAVFDWDSAAFGAAMDDLAYAAWMWLDIGNDELAPGVTARRLRLMLDAYGARAEDRLGFCGRMHAQMARVAGGRYPTQEQAKATAAWAMACNRWLKENEDAFDMSSR